MEQKSIEEFMIPLSTNKRMKVLFIVPYPVGIAPNQRFRYEQYLDVLSSNNIEYAIRPFASARLYKILYKQGYFFEKFIHTFLGIFYRIWNVIEAFNFDIIYISREAFPYGPAFFEWLLARWGKPMIFDFDDSIYLPDASSANRIFTFLKHSNKTAKAIKLCKYVTPGNKFLANYADKHNKNFKIIPTTVDTQLYKPKRKSGNKEIIIGWSGSPTTVKFLNLLKGVFVTVSKKYPNVKFKIYGSTDFSIPGVALEATNWSLDTEINELQSFDIGIMPLPDDEWARGKCGFKALLYMAFGIPAVCSPVGVNTEIIQDGVNGFLALTEQEWIEKLSRLIEDVELRYQLGDRGRKTVEERYSKQTNANKYLDVFTAACNNMPLERKEKIHVLELITDLDIGGIPTLLSSLTERLDRNKYKIVVCSLKSRSKHSVSEAIQKTGSRLVFLDATVLRTFVVLHRLYLLLKDERIDIVNNWLFHANIFGTLAGKIARVPYIISSTFAIDVKKSLVRIMLDRVAMRFSDLVLANAEAVKDVFIKREKVQPSKIAVIYTGIDLNYFKRTNHSIPEKMIDMAIPNDNGPIITSVARLHAVKGLRYLIEAMVEVLKKKPGARLVLVGDGPIGPNLRKRAKRMRLDKNVLFMGAEPNMNIPGILAHSDVFALPSLEEGLPGSLLEAMGMEVPVVVTNVGGVGEVVKDGKTGFMVPNSNSSDLSRVILKVLDERNQTERIVKAARQSLEKNFDINIMTKKIENIYDELNNHRGTR